MPQQRTRSKCTHKIKILFTCIGRRVSLLEAFRRAAARLHLDAVMCGTDITLQSPALQLCDEKYLVSPTSRSSYTAELVSLVKTRQIDLIVPTVDLDLKKLAHSRRRLAGMGCHVLVSRPSVIATGQDKRRTYAWLTRHGFDTPVTWPARALLGGTDNHDVVFPCYLKPWDGYASRSALLVADREELAFYARRIPHALCQEFIQGDEYTCDVYVDRNLQVRCVVPRQRLEVRNGEVSKALTVKDRAIMDRVASLVETLQAGPGVITVQLIKTSDGRHKIIEINPRFGGGAPLSIRAGADFPRWILQELTGQRPACRFDGFRDRLTMLRYDAEVWVHA